MNASLVSSSTTSSSTDAKVEKPGKPLNSYNLFFRYERERILRGLDHLPITIQSVANICGDKRYECRKRQHRKTHGRIGFKDLSRMISDKWKNIDDNVRDMFEARAAIEKRRYLTMLQKWTQKTSSKPSGQKNNNQKSVSMESSDSVLDDCDDDTPQLSTSSTSSVCSKEESPARNGLEETEIADLDEFGSQKIEDVQERIGSDAMSMHNVGGNVSNDGKACLPTINEDLRKCQGRSSSPIASWNNRVIGEQPTTADDVEQEPIRGRAFAGLTATMTVCETPIKEQMKQMNMTYAFLNQMMPVAGCYSGIDINTSPSSDQLVNELDNFGQNGMMQENLTNNRYYVDDDIEQDDDDDFDDYDHINSAYHSWADKAGFPSVPVMMQIMRTNHNNNNNNPNDARLALWKSSNPMFMSLNSNTIKPKMIRRFPSQIVCTNRPIGANFPMAVDRSLGMMSSVANNNTMLNNRMYSMLMPNLPYWNMPNTLAGAGGKMLSSTPPGNQNSNRMR